MLKFPRDPAAKQPAPPQDEVEKFLSEQKTMEAHREDLIKELLRQKEEAIETFDEKLARLGYEVNHRSRRSHHKKKPEKAK